VFDNPRPDTAAIIDFYSKPHQYDGWLKEERARSRLWRRRVKKMRKSLSRIEGLKDRKCDLLDIGAGIGQFLYEAQTHFNSVTGTEVSASAVALADVKFKLTLREGTLETLDWSGQSFDCITAFHVWEHVPFPGKFLEVIRGLLRPGGCLLLAVPNDLESLGAGIRRFKIHLRCWVGRKEHLDRGNWGLPSLSLTGTMDELHLSHFTQDSIKALLEIHGFRLIDLSLDPFYVASGVRLIRHSIRFGLCEMWRRLTGINLYGTHWVVAVKR
jgi:SAM-dependent methyltransferase